MLEGTPWGAHWHFPLVGPRSRARTADPRTLCSIRLKYEIWPVGPKFDTDSRGLSPKATGLHLVSVGGATLDSTLVLHRNSTVACRVTNVTSEHYDDP